MKQVKRKLAVALWASIGFLITSHTKNVQLDWDLECLEARTKLWSHFAQAIL